MLEGDTAKQVRQILRERGLTPVSIEGVAEKESAQRSAFSWRTISSTDLALVTRQLATLIRSGTVLEEALRAVADQSEKKRIQAFFLLSAPKFLKATHWLGPWQIFHPYFLNCTRPLLRLANRPAISTWFLNAWLTIQSSDNKLSRKLFLPFFTPFC